MLSMRDQIRKRAKERTSNSGGGGSYLRLPEGTKVFKVDSKKISIDILPYKVTSPNLDKIPAGQFWYRKLYYLHRNVGADNGSYVCPNRTARKRCPICENRAEMLRNVPADEKEAKAYKVLTDGLRPKERELFNIIDTEDPKAGVQVFDISTWLFGQKLEEEVDAGEPKIGDFSNLSGGSTINARFTEESFNKQDFFKISRIDFEPREEYTNKILEKTIDLDKCLVIPSYEELESLFLEIEGEESSEDDLEDDKPSRETEDVSVKKKRLPAEEEDDEAPIRKKRLPAEEEDDEAPIRKKRLLAEEEDEAPKRKKTEEDVTPKRTRKREEDEGSSGKCPSGGVLGKDTDTLDACDKCKIWDECSEEYDKARQKKK